MNPNEPWQTLLTAWLHDPIDKAASLPGYKLRAQGYAREILGPDVTAEELHGRNADRIASSFERLPMPDTSGTDNELGVSPENGHLQIFHPLSATPRDIQISLEEEKVLALLHAMGLAALPPKLKFLTLWRQVPEKMAELNPDLRWQPADTRCPDHTLWQHLDSTAALAWAMDGEAGAAALLSFKIGPVQTFIEAARSMRDLLTGSYLLSTLAFAAIRPILETCGPTALVYPALRGLPVMDEWLLEQGVNLPKPIQESLTRPALPHRFLALVPARLLEQLKAEVRARAAKRWKEISEEVHTELGRKWNNGFPGWDRLWQDQIDSFWDFRTTAFRLSDANHTELLGAEAATRFEAIAKLGQASDVRPGYWQRSVEISAALMEAETQIRHIPEYRPSRPVPQKCELLGTLEQMGPATLRESTAFWAAAAAADPIQSKNRLCAVSLVKRHHLRHLTGFPDTREIAASNAMLGDKAKYYAVLMLDGDHMGAWLSGANSPPVRDILHPKILAHHAGKGRDDGLDSRRPVSPALHAAISEGLTRFSTMHAPRIVEACRGKLIYAGGDDVLAVLPLDTALECASRLRAAFSEDDVLGGTATCSAGVAVAHCMEDLRIVLQAARAAEKRAKNDGRNRFALSVLRRSGEHATASCSWGYITHLGSLTSAFAKGASNRWAYQIRGQMAVYEGLPLEAFECEIARLLNRTEERRELKEPVEKGLKEYLKEEKREYKAVIRDWVTLCQSAAFLARGRDH